MTPLEFRALEPEREPPAYLLPACRSFISAAQWNYAKTFATFAPHWYCLRREVRASGIEEAFDEFASVIDRGYLGAFGRAQRRYINLDGYRFWHMEPRFTPPISVLNKAVIEPTPEPAQLSLEVD